MIASVKHEYVGNFRDPMTIVKLGPLRGRRWNLGRLRYLELGVCAPLAPVVLALHEEFGDNVLPHHAIVPHMTLRWGKVSLRLM